MAAFAFLIALVTAACAAHALLLHWASRVVLQACMTWRQSGWYSAALCLPCIVLGAFVVGLIGAAIAYLLLATNFYSTRVVKPGGRPVGMGKGFVLALATGAPVWAGCVSIARAVA